MSSNRRPARTRVASARVIGAVTGALVLGAGAAALAPAQDGSARAQQDPGPQNVVLRTGDTLRVEGTRLACQVTRRDGRATIECRRTGRLRGSYTTVLTERRAMVARFRSGTVAKVVFTARHGGEGRACAAARGAPGCE